MPKSAMTVNDIWQLVLPADALLLAGRDGLQRPAEWATALRATAPLFADLQEGYVALARLAFLRGLSPAVSHVDLVGGLARIHAAALVVDEAVSDQAVALAERLSLPLLLLPEYVDLHALERSILRALVDYEGQLARRDVEIGDELQRRYATTGLQAVLDQVAHATQGKVVLHDAEGNLKLTSGASHALGDLRETHLPVEAAGRTLGQLTLRTDARRQHPLDETWALRAAVLCGVELLQHLTRQETEERLGADLVEQILEGALPPDAVTARLARMGYDLSPKRRHLVIALGNMNSANDGAAADAAGCDLRWLGQREGAAMLSLGYRDDTLILLGLPGELPERRVREWVAQAFDGCIGRGIAVGTSRVVDGVSGLSMAIRQAMEAWRLGRRISGRRGPHSYGEMGLYRLLAGLRDREELGRFYRETLGPLIDYDREHNTELLPTLQAFFEHHGNASQTAKALFVHRNTLNYRLQRIGEITQWDLDDPEARLDAQVALRILQLR
jgi:purine catabolism regulator